MFPCSSCHRHVAPSKDPSDSSCPFCGAALRDAPAPPAFAGLLLGLSLMGCGDRSTGDEEAADEATEPTVTASSDESESSSASGTESTTANQETAEASDYGGPEATSDPDTGPLPESSGEDSTGEDSSTTGDDTSSSDTSGTDTGATTTDSSAEGADYGAAPPIDPPL